MINRSPRTRGRENARSNNSKEMRTGFNVYQRKTSKSLNRYRLLKSKIASEFKFEKRICTWEKCHGDETETFTSEKTEGRNSMRKICTKRRATTSQKSYQAKKSQPPAAMMNQFRRLRQQGLPTIGNSITSPTIGN